MGLFDFLKNPKIGDWAIGSIAWETIETFLENQGILQVERNSEGKAIKRKIFGFGPNDEALYLLAWYDAFESQNLFEEKIDIQYLKRTWRTFDRLPRSHCKKMKDIIGMQEKEISSTATIEKTGGGKGKGPMKEVINRKSVWQNVDGKKILILCATIVKNDGEDELINFLNGEIFVPFSQIAEEALTGLNTAVGKTLDAMGIDSEQRELKIVNLQNSIDASKLEALTLRAELKGVSIEELLQQT